MKKEKVESLEQARAQIDVIDHGIIELIAARQFYVDQAVRFKRSVQDVQSPERVEAVISKIRLQATEHGVNADTVERLYRDMIQHFIQRELKEIRP
ncbi:MULTISPECIES: chorismate mutase [unclassified Acinetobacter]|uniref:chorismate mutase n=1 Tax=unclassified Acinetobacter TaxID=196816 RepID=UPI0015D135D7|nr:MULTISPECIES: chorismate mutase [unclassified Acinetobacter]UUS65230.1 chorismate mutase [Acinetobacter sp. YH12068_T]